MDRRHFLTISASIGALGWLTSRCAWAEMDHAAHSGGAPVTLKTAADTPLLSESALASGHAHVPLAALRNTETTPKLFQATLTAAAHEIELLAGTKTPMWLYNGQVPGPLIEAFEGDEVEIRFVNQLAQASTIHWHGLPVPPEQDGNPQDAVPAGGERVYRFKLPKDSAGTYWYHPHPHGDTPEQVYRGLAGLFIVRSKSDPLADFAEQHLVISD
ncbi:multicopper oxidase domain-containing protein [Chitinibacter sp. S2-10]|uniref:multicopper oxidase domain-containing protein n=1 Tax=Chitinibacter sp. S2-10 TaxID=3373597 RepID=UPI0039776C3A